MSFKKRFIALFLVLALMAAGTVIYINISGDTFTETPVPYTYISRYPINNASLTCGGVSYAMANACVRTWLATQFAGGRHQRRIDKIEA